MNYYSKKIIESGEYEGVQLKVGAEIKPGTYAIFAYDNDNDANVCLSADANQDNIIIYESFPFNLFLIIKEKQYLEISNAYMVDFEEVKQLNPKKANMLIVGKDIPEGEYKFTVLPNEDDGNYAIYNSIALFSKDELENYESFDKQNYATLKNGQVINYKTCSFVRIGDLPKEDNEDDKETDEAASSSGHKTGITFSINGKKLSSREDFVSSFQNALLQSIGNAVYDKIQDKIQDEEELTEYEREDYEEFENIFKTVIADYGRLLLKKQNSNKLSALLSDFASKYKRMINEIKIVTENGFIDNLLTIEDEKDINELINVQLDLLINDNDFSEESAQIIVKMILNCFK